MANTITITGISRNQTGLWIDFKVKLTGSYVQAGVGVGEILNFPAATMDPLYLGSSGVFPPLSNQVPIFGEVACTSGDITNMFFFVTGTLTTSKIKIATAYGTELGAGAYSALLLSDTIEGRIGVNCSI
jgi:hypothetical protein